MRYPYVHIVSSDGITTKIYYIEHEHAEPVEISKVIESMCFEHTAGEYSRLTVKIPLPCLVASTNQIKIAIEQMQGGGGVQEINEENAGA